MQVLDVKWSSRFFEMSLPFMRQRAGVFRKVAITRKMSRCMMLTCRGVTGCLGARPVIALGFHCDLVWLCISPTCQYFVFSTEDQTLQLCHGIGYLETAAAAGSVCSSVM